MLRGGVFKNYELKELQCWKEHYTIMLEGKIFPMGVLVIHWDAFFTARKVCFVYI